MTATLTRDDTFDPADAGDPGRPAHRRLPVGARFPRWTPTDEREQLSAEATPAAGPVFPVGARFPRWTAAEIDAHLAGLAARPVTFPIRRRPIGARFPRRWGP